MIGSGIRNFEDAREWCQDQDNSAPSNRKGWDLAIIPTHMHNLEVSHHTLANRQLGTYQV